MRIAMLVSIAMLASEPAIAGVVVVSQDTGRKCYLQTLADLSPENIRQALAICSQAITDNGDDPHNRAAALVNRADIRLRLPDYPGVISDADAAIALEPSIAEAYANRGAGLIGERRFNEALIALNKAVDLESPSSEIAYYNRAIAKEALGDVKGAYYDFKAANDINSQFTLAAEQLVRFRVIKH
jgi:tetratricopeptide (TPR) repeat protein